MTVENKGAGPRIIAVASGKGGVGKTFLAVSLAQVFAAKKQRVLLFDGDLGLANVDVQLGLTPKSDLATVIAEHRPLTDAITPFGGGASDGGFDILAGRSGSGALSNLPRHQLELLIQSLKLVAPAYDRTIIDLGAGIDVSVLSLAAASDLALVVMTDEPTSLTDAYALIKLMVKSGAPTRITVAVNMATSPAEGRKSWGALANATRSFLGLEPSLAGVIRRDQRVKDSIRRQLPFVTRHPTAPAAEDFSALADTLLASQAGHRSLAAQRFAKLK
jgi:flagellar biosynthesis protein FlhG